MIVGFTGGPGAAYGVRLLEALREAGHETHLVMCGCAAASLREQTGTDARSILALAAQTYNEWNQAARISSGSFLTAGMIVAPCSTRSLASIAYGYANNLIHRAADVTIKEGRPLAVLIADPRLGGVDLENLDRLGSVPGVTVIRVPPAADPSSLDGAISALVDVLELVPSSSERLGD
ncbi:MAG TPA: UbiX family flavin prenyltransferase [Actinomycetota bacterium]